MRSGSQAVVFVFTWILCVTPYGQNGGTARAASYNFLQPCAQADSTASEARFVPGSRGNKHLVVAAGQAGIYETRDNGETWDLLTPRGMCHRPVRAFWENSPDGDTLCVVTPPQHGGYNTFCSHNRGLSWEAQTWITDAEHVLFDPSDAARAFGWTPTNRCNRICTGPTYGIAMSHAKSGDKHCACNLQLAHTAGANPRLLALRDIDTSGQNQLVGMSRDMERESVLVRETNPNVRMLQLYANPLNDRSFAVSIAQRTPLGRETGLCCDALYETADGGRSRSTWPLLFGPVESLVFTSSEGNIAALVHPPHALDTAYIAAKLFGSGEWTWKRAPEAQGKLLAVDNVLYFAGKHLYRVDVSPYVVIDPVY